VSWTAPPDTDFSSDAIKLFAVVATDALVSSQPTNGLPVGDLSFTAPTSPGTYEFRYVRADGTMAATAQIAVAGD
jgi:hypothetical protein